MIFGRREALKDLLAGKVNIGIVAEKTVTTDNPNLDSDSTLTTPEIPFISFSIGKVMSCSTSCGARPCASVSISTCTGVTSGNASTFKRLSARMPPATMSIETTTTSNRSR
jgi:hypothetical protein